MKVKWTEYPNIASIATIMSWYPEARLSDFDNHFKGDVVDTVKSFWGDTYFVVACEDGVIREVEISKAKIVK